MVLERPQGQHTLKERVESAPKKLIRRGLDDDIERLRGQLRDVAQHGQRDDFGGDQLGDAEVSGVKRAAKERCGTQPRYRSKRAFWPS